MWHKINGPRQKMYCVQENSVYSKKPKVLAGLDAGEGHWAGSYCRLRATDVSFCLEKRHSSLVYKSRTQSIYDDDQSQYLYVLQVTLFHQCLCY